MFWLERTPLWVIGGLIMLSLVVAEQLGFGARRLTWRLRGTGSSDGVDYVETGALALLALLVAFTFSAAANRYDARRLLVVAEANAIGTTYLRAQALDPAPRAALSQLMVQYVHIRSAWLEAGEDQARATQALAETDALQTKIWAAVVGDVRANPAATINPSLLQTTNEMFDLAATVRAAFDARLPISILRAMILYALIAAAIMGYGFAAKGRRLAVSAALYLGLAIVVCLVLDLDRSHSGTVLISRAPMTRAIASIDAAEAAKAAAPPAP